MDGARFVVAEQVPDTWESIHAKGGETGGYRVYFNAVGH